MIFVPSLEYQVGTCLYVTAAVRCGSLRASRTWSQRPKSVQGSLESVGALVFQLILLLTPCSLLRLVSTLWTASRCGLDHLPSSQRYPLCTGDQHRTDSTIYLYYIGLRRYTMLHFGISTSYWPIGFLSSILFFIQTLAYPFSLSSFSTYDDDDDYDHGSLSSSRPSSFSDSFDSTFNLDEDANLSFALSVTIPSAEIQTLTVFSPTEPLSFCRGKHSFSAIFTS